MKPLPETALDCIDFATDVLPASAERGFGPVDGTPDARDLLLTLTEAASREMRLPCDRAAVRRTIQECIDVMSAVGELADRCADALLHAAAAWPMRIDRLPLTPADAIAAVRPTAPIGHLWQAADSGLRWVLVAEQRGSQVRVVESVRPTETRWISRQKLPAIIGTLPDGRGQWLAFQPKLPCTVPGDHHGASPSPLARFLALLAPERSDIGVIIVFAVVVGLLALSTPLAVEALVNTVAFGQFVQPVIVLALILFVFLAFAAAMRGVQVYVAEIIQRRIFVRVASDLSQRLPRVDTGFWYSHYGPELVNRFFEVVTVQKVTTQLLLDGTAVVLQALVGMAVIAFYHPLLLGFDLFLIVVVVLIILVMGRGAVATSIDESRQKYATAAWLEELARHPLAFRSRGGLNFALDQADRRVTAYLTARASHFRILMGQIVASLVLQVIASTVLLGLGGWLVIRGELTLGQLVAAELIVTVIVGSFAKIGKYLEGYYDVMAAVDKIGHLVDMPLQPSEGIEMSRRPEGMSLAIHELTSAKLPNGQQIVHAKMHLSPGERAALVGPSAALRTALLETIAGLRRPDSGHVELDSCDVRRLRLESIQDQVAFVAGIEVFGGSIAENIHLGRTNVTESSIRGALQMVGLLDEILDLPEGLATRIDTDGRQLAGDQLARLVLARAIAARPRLLLIDGLLDGLPDDLLGSVSAALEQALTDCTSLVATGRRDVAQRFARQVKLGADGRLDASLPARKVSPPRVKSRGRRKHHEKYSQ